MSSARQAPAWLGVLCAVVLLGGCATEPGMFQFNAAPSSEATPLVWPPADSGSPARYRWLGVINGESNFYIPQSDTKAGIVTAFKWIVGLFDSQNPDVLLRPQTGMVDEAGRIYVTDVSRNAVFVFDNVAGEMRIWEKVDGLKNFGSPVGISAGPAGDILVADSKLGLVARFDVKGISRGSFGKGVLKRPTGLAYDPAARRVYVSDTTEHDIKVFDDEGRLVKTIGHRGEGEVEFNFPTHLAFVRGELYVSDSMNSRIQVLSDEGEKAKVRFGERGMFVGDLVRPKGVSVDSEGNIYVIESLHDSLLVFNRKGELLLPIGGTGQNIGEFYLPAGVWVDQNDRVFVADMFNGRVEVFQFLGGSKDGS